KRWIDLLALSPAMVDPEGPRRRVPAVALEPLGEKFTIRPGISGWKRRGAELPSLVANSSDKTEHIPGRVPPHKVAVHPTPDRFVAVTWKSPIDGKVRISATVTHAHPACGNGVAWFVEHRSDARTFELAQGVAELGKESQMPARTLTIAKGDLILLAI